MKLDTPLSQVRVLNIGIGWAGRVASMLLAEQGADVAVADIDQEGSLTVSKQIIQTGRRSIFLDIDVTSRASIDLGMKTFLMNLHSWTFS